MRVIVVLVLIMSANIFAQRTLTIDESIKIALQNNTILQRSSNDIAGYQSTVKSEYGGLLPSVGVGGQWQWSRNETSGSTRIVEGNPFFVPGGTTENRQMGVSANADWTLFDGLANFASISKAKNNLESARLNLERLKQDIVFGTISRYYSVLNAKELVKVREDDLAYNQKNLETISERNKLGAVTLADVYAQQVLVGNSELALIQAKNDYDNLRSDLLSFLGQDVLQDLELVDPLQANGKDKIEAEDLLKQYQNVNTLVDEAINNRYDLKGAQLALESANDNITISQSGYFPSLSNRNSFSMGANKFDEIKDNKTYTVSLSLSIPIFSGWFTENSVQLAKIAAKNQEVTITELERDIKINLKTTYLSFQAAQKSLEVSEQNVLSAQQNRQIEQEKYNLGAGTLVTLLVAISNYTSALQTNITAKYNFYTLKSQLEYYLGTIDYKKYE